MSGVASPTLRRTGSPLAEAPLASEHENAGSGVTLTCGVEKEEEFLSTNHPKITPGPPLLSHGSFLITSMFSSRRRSCILAIAEDTSMRIPLNVSNN